MFCLMQYPVIAFVYLSDVDRPTVCHCVPKKVTTSVGEYLNSICN